MPNVAINNLSETWNNAGTTFTGIKLNVTDTASASGSLLLDVQKGGTSQLVLNKSGNLGIGTSAPNGKLSIKQSTAQIDITTGASDVSFEAISRADTTAAIDTKYYTRNGTFQWINSSYAERMRLDSSGNLGLGVTPSAWLTSYGTKAIQVAASGVIYGLDVSSSDRRIGVSSNSFINTSANNTYINDGHATTYVQVGGEQIFYTAPSGTAGGAITFAERFKVAQNSVVFNEPGNDYDFRVEGDTDANLFFVDASTDRIGIGTNAPSAKLQIVGSGVDAAGAYIGSGNSNLFDAQNNVFRLSNQTEVMRLNSLGNLLLGGTSTPTNGTKCLTITTGTAPTASPADTFTIYSSDVSAGNTTLSIYTEGTPVSDSTDNAVTKKIAVRINGTLYYLLADTDNS